MSTVSIRAALETGLNSMTPALSTAWENVPFTTPTSAYQVAHLMFAQPDNATIGHDYHQEIGMLQVDLMYPENTGSSAAYTRAELIRDTFYRGATFTAGGVSVIIERTPEIMPGTNDGGRYILPVRIRFFAGIFN